MDGQDVGPGDEIGYSGGDIEGFGDEGFAVQGFVGCNGVPCEGGGRAVAACDLVAVDVGDEAVVVLHMEEQLLDADGVGDGEWDADIGGAVDVVHCGPDVGSDVVGDSDEGESAVSGVSDEAEGAIEGGFCSGCGEELDAGVAAALIEGEGDAVLAGGECCDAEGIGGGSAAGVGHAVAACGGA